MGAWTGKAGNGDSGPTPGFLNHAPVTVRVLLVLAVLHPFLIAGWFAWHQHTVVLHEAESSAQRSVVALVEHAGNVLQVHSLMLTQVASMTEGRSGPALAADQALLQTFADLTARYEQVSVIGVTDAEGRVWASSFRVNPADASVAYRDYFIAHQSGTAQGMYFSEAFTGKISGKRSFAISIARRTPSGKFDGIVFATVPLDYLMRFWKQFAPSSGYLIPMIRDDGTLIVRYPALNNPERLDPNGPFVSQVRRAPRGIYTARSRVDGIERINAYSQIKDYPLYVSYSIEKDVVLQQWRREVVVVFAVALVVMAALVTLLLLLMRQSQRERQAVAQWRKLAVTLEREVTRREEAEAALRQGQKMEAIGQLTGGLAHDFNNLLAAISGNLELMRIRLQQGLAMEVPRYIDAIESVVDKATGITRRLLAFARRQELSPVPTNVNERIVSMLDLIARTAGPSIVMQTDLAPALWNSLCDPGEFDSALLNLAINARDAMPDGGKLTVVTKNVQLADAESASTVGVAPGDYVVISVSDTGTGMHPEVLQRAFDPFFSTKPAGQGTGLGLSMVYGFATQSGGGIRMESAVNVGTVVRIFLPRYEGELPPQPMTPVDDSEVQAMKKGTVIVVDDEAPLRNLLSEVLSTVGYRVVPTADGESALRALETSGPVHLLVADVGLPGGMNGKQLADKARSIRPELKVMFITGYAEEPVPESSAEVAEVMFKPFKLDEFTRRVAEQMSRRSP
ncbi:MAG TPA: ATP-binding protein [Noviherbaspirillum sp.]|nr:ATP-binding protein [Noviherbaspirillum sp.]